MNDSIIKTLAVAFSVCLICSLVVSSSAVSLRDLQKENKLNDRRLKVLQVADIYNPELSISEQFLQLESKFVDFDKRKEFIGAYEEKKDKKNNRHNEPGEFSQQFKDRTKDDSWAENLEL